MVSVLHKLPDGSLIVLVGGLHDVKTHIMRQPPFAPVWHSGWSGWPALVTRVANCILPHPLASFQFVLNGGLPIYGCLSPGSHRDHRVIPGH